MNRRELSLMFSSKTGEWETPLEVFNPLDEEFHFAVDVCANENNTKAQLWFGRGGVCPDGLAANWTAWGHVFWMNPPYGRVIGLWVKKAYEESLKGATVVCLLPARTDTKWFHEYILGKAEIRFVKGRIAFLGEAKTNPNQQLLAPIEVEEKNKNKNMPFAAPFPSMIVVYRPPLMVGPAYSEPCYCSVCDFTFISRSPDPICPRCRGIRNLYDSKAAYDRSPMKA